MKDFTKEEAAYFAHMSIDSEDQPVTEEQEDEMRMSRKEASAYLRAQGFDVVAHARTKTIGENVGEVARYAAGREQQMKSCPLLAQVRQHNKEAEERLSSARGKEFPEEAKPEDMYKHIDITIEEAREALDEFLAEAASDFSSKEADMMNRKDINRYFFQNDDIETNLIVDPRDKTIYLRCYSRSWW